MTKNEQLTDEILDDLDLLRSALAVGNDVVARNLIGYLEFDVMPGLPPGQKTMLQARLEELAAELLVPTKRRFKPRPVRSRLIQGRTFTCVFCHQRWGWDSAKEIPGDPRRHACTNCAKTVMCPGCGRRKKDGFSTCLRCSGAKSVGARPHGFHN